MFDCLFGDKPEELFIALFVLPSAESSFHKSIQDVVDKVDAYKKERIDIYFGLGLHSADHGRNRRGKHEDVAGITCLWADLDFGSSGVHSKKKLPPDQLACSKLIEKFPSPTIIVMSGHGLQVYWKFKEPWIFTCNEDREQAHALSQRWNTALQNESARHGWEIDSVKDLTRIFRVPGTTNYKAQPVSVEILHLDASGRLDYSFSDFEPYIEGIELSSDDDDTKIIRLDSFTLDAQASPPFDKFDILLANEPKAKKSWERTRRDMHDNSASGYDLSLASFALQAGWSDQETVDLMIASRRRHGDNLKLREDYYKRTVGLVKRNKTVENIDNAIQEVNQNVNDPDERKSSLIDTLSIAFGVKIVRIVKYLTAEPTYVLETMGRIIELGNVRNLIHQDLFRDKMADVAETYIPLFKSKKWATLAQALLDVCESKEVSLETTLHGQIKSWIETYLSETHISDEITDAIGHRTPFLNGKDYCIFLSDFKRWLAFNQNERIGTIKLASKMREAGCESSVIAVQLNGKSSTRGVWKIPWR